MRYKKNNNFKRRKIVHSIPIGCMLALLLLGGICINPTGLSNSMNGGIGSNGSAYAEEGISTQADGMSVSLRMDGDANTLTNNSKTGQVNYISSGFTVTTANVDGYNVYVQTAPGSTNKLTNGSLTVDFVKVDTPTSEFTDNTWGYAVDSTGATPENLKYNPVPDSATTALNPAYSSTSTGETRNFTINFATKFGANATPGHYTTGILLSAVAGVEEVANWNQFGNYTNMQGFTKAQCNTIPIGTEGRLKDTRDNKWYWVARQSDGLCWMTQNLDYDGGGTKITDPLSNWISSDSDAYYYDPGKYVLANPTISQNCIMSQYPNSLSACTGFGWKLASEVNTSDIPAFKIDSSWIKTYDKDFIAATSYISNDGKMSCTKTPGYYGDMTSDYIPCRMYSAFAPALSAQAYEHYAVGKYYNFIAATNGTGKDLTAESNASGSICPSGWNLPLSGKDVTTAGSFNGLFAADPRIDDVDVRVAPYYFVTAGQVSTQIAFASQNAIYYSSTAAASEQPNGKKKAYMLITSGAAQTNQSFSNAATLGLPIRCVMR